MATYEEYMNAARNADAAGDEAAARQLVQAAMALGQQAEPQGLGAAMGLAPIKKEGQTFGQALYENIVGEGKVDTLGEQIGDVIGTAAAGGYRGIKGLLETPEMLMRLGKRTGEEISTLTGARDPSKEKTSILDTKTGQLVEGLYGKVGVDKDYLSRRGETTAAQYAGTIGEFLPAAIGGGASAAKAALAAAVGSETAGQLAEGSAYEPVARIVGAFASPMALSTAKNVANKTVQLTQKRAIQQPAVETARQAKDASYKAFETAGGQVKIPMGDIVKDVDLAINADDLFIAYVPQGGGSNQYIDEARKALIKHTGKDFNLAQLDKLRSALGDVYRQSNFDPRVEFIRDKLDDVIQNAPVTASGKAGDLLKTARQDFRRYKKIELFDDLMGKAERTAAATGSGGNVVNKYRQAANQILNNRYKRNQFDKDELEMMQRFVEGSIPENALRLIGKLSPSGNGLMAALNVAAIANNPAMVLGTVTGVAAKAKSEAMSKDAVEAIRKALISGVDKSQRGPFERELRTFLGLQANEGQ